MEEEDLRKRREDLDMLREKLRRGEQLTDKEKARLAELEEWDRLIKLKELERREDMRLVQIEKDMALIKEKGEDNMTDMDRLNMLILEKEKCEILCAKLRRIPKDEMTDHDIELIHKFEDEIDRLEYEILLMKQKLGLLTEEEAQKLRELETKFKMNEMSMIEGNNNQEEGDIENPFEE